LNLDIANWLFVFLRVSAVVMVFPVFSAKNIPARVRVALAALTAFLISPGLPPFAVEGFGLWQVVGIMLRELINGLFIGFVARMVFLCLDIAGNIIATEVGLNLASDVNPVSGVRTEVPGLILFYLASMMFLALDIHHYLLAALERGYTVLPIGAGVMGNAALDEIIAHTSRIFGVAVQIAAPMMAVSFIVMLVFSLIGRAVQQISSFFESFAVRVLAGLFVFGLTMNLMAQHIAAYLQRLPDDVMRITELLATA
jgi:flagellar biosynthesis protein FliR